MIRWDEIAREADLSAEEIAVLARAFLPPEPINSISVQRAADRVWVESRRAPDGSIARRLTDLGRIGGSQLRLFGLPFWVVAIAMMAAGTIAVGIGLDPGRTLSFYLAAPAMACAATWAAFRGRDLGAQELELSTPLSPRELLLIRLLLILGCDIGLGLLASGALAIFGVPGIDGIVLAWICPLIFVVGATLTLASWTRVEQSAAIVYGLWVTCVVAVARLWTISASSLPSIELAMLIAGVALGGLVLASIPGRFRRLSGASLA